MAKDNQQVYAVNSWYGGMSNDEYAGAKGSAYSLRNVSVRSNSREVSLAPVGNGSPTLLNTRTDGYSQAILRGTTGGDLYFSRDGHVQRPDYGDVYVIPSSEGIKNVTKVMDASRNQYGVIISDTGKVHRWPYVETDGFLGMLSSELVANPSFTSGTSWSQVNPSCFTFGSGAVHVVGQTGALSQTLVATVGKKYRVEVNVTMSAGSLEIRFPSSASALGTVTATGRYSYVVTATSTNPDIWFAPTSNMAGTIASVSVREVTVTETVCTLPNTTAYAFCPVYNAYNRIYVGCRDKVDAIELTTWTAQTMVTLDGNADVRSISNVGDQFFLYANLGDNGRCYVWDGGSQTVSYAVNWLDKPIVNAVNVNNADYVVTGTSSTRQLYLSQGYQPAIQMNSGFITNPYSDRLSFGGDYPNAVETVKNVMLIGGTGGIHTYGFVVPGLPNSCVKEYCFEGKATALYSSETSNYNVAVGISSTSGSPKNYAYVIPLTNVEYSTKDPGEIIMQPILGPLESDVKQSMKWRVGYRLETGTSINVYSKTDDASDYANFYVTGVTTVPTVGAVYSYSGNNYSVYSVTHLGTGALILHCTGTGITQYGITISKVSGTGDSSIYALRTDSGFKLDNKVTDSTKRKFLDGTAGSQRRFNKIQYKLDLVTSDPSKTPHLFDFSCVYQNIENDLGS